jgi:hypothetical protein
MYKNLAGAVRQLSTARAITLIAAGILTAVSQCLHRQHRFYSQMQFENSGTATRDMDF